VLVYMGGSSRCDTAFKWLDGARAMRLSRFGSKAPQPIVLYVCILPSLFACIFLPSAACGRAPSSPPNWASCKHAKHLRTYHTFHQLGHSPFCSSSMRPPHSVLTLLTASATLLSCLTAHPLVASVRALNSAVSPSLPFQTSIY